MADPLGASVRMPSSKKLSTAITAYFELASDGASPSTLTLDSDYPPIDLSIQSPVLGIFLINDETAVAIADPEHFIPAGQMARGTAPDSAGEFQLTGARTINVFHTGDKNSKGMITYIQQGSPQLT